MLRCSSVLLVLVLVLVFGMSSLMTRCDAIAVRFWQSSSTCSGTANDQQNRVANATCDVGDKSSGLVTCFPGGTASVTVYSDGQCRTPLLLGTINGDGATCGTLSLASGGNGTKAYFQVDCNQATKGATMSVAAIVATIITAAIGAAAW